MSEQNTRNGNADVFKKAWRGFQGAKWTDEVNVREFIQNNYTQYDGTEDFLAAPTEATDKLWGRLQELQKEERKKGGVLECETEIVSSLTSYGPGYIEDTLCGVPVRLGPLSFYQVNTLAAERLYGIAAEYAQLEPSDVLLDLYCGMGTIGLSMADRCRELIGVEIVPEAIDSAKANAARMGDAVAAKSRFFCADAGQAAARLAAEGLRPDVIMLDPPRKGCDETTLSAVVQMSPRRVVYVSCNPSTAARDAAWLEEHGYHAEKVQPVDLFPRTRHCECVLALSKGEIDS